MTVESLYRVGAISQFEYEQRLLEQKKREEEQKTEETKDDDIEPFSDVFERAMCRYR